MITVEIQVNLLGIKRTFKVNFDKLSFTVLSDSNCVIDGGYFGFNGTPYFTERTREVELFYQPLEEKVIKAMKSKKEEWREMVKYQNGKRL
jgi:hypothetical protein